MSNLDSQHIFVLRDYFHSICYGTFNTWQDPSPKYCIQCFSVLFYKIILHKCLNGSGKSASMHTAYSMVSEYISLTARAMDTAWFCVTVSIYILKIFERGISGCFDHIKEIFKSSFSEGMQPVLQLLALSPKKCIARSTGRSQASRGVPGSLQNFFIYVTENFFSKICCNSFHIRGICA